MMCQIMLHTVLLLNSFLMSVGKVRDSSHRNSPTTDDYRNHNKLKFNKVIAKWVPKQLFMDNSRDDFTFLEKSDFATTMMVVIICCNWLDSCAPLHHRAKTLAWNADQNRTISADKVMATGFFLGKLFFLSCKKLNNDDWLFPRNHGFSWKYIYSTCRTILIR